MSRSRSQSDESDLAEQRLLPLRHALVRLAAELAALGVILGIDALMGHHDYSRPVQGLLDEPAHLLTALIVLTALRYDSFSPFWVSAALASVLIDLDHLPGELGYAFLQHGEPRPYTHSLLFAGCFVLLGLRLTETRQQCVRGIAAGILLHLLRDLVTGAVPLFWPVLTIGIQVPYGLYPVTLATVAFLGLFAAPAAKAPREPPAAELE